MQLVRVQSGTQQTYLDGSVLTIGNFDGVHRGHAEIFRRLIDHGKNRQLPTVAMTFDPHPLAVLAPDNAPPQLTTFAQKAELIERAGIDCLAVISFCRDFSLMAADTFVRQVLCHGFCMRHMIIGHDYAFGRDRQGTHETLQEMGRENGFSIEDIDPFGKGSEIYSSSLVRRLVSEGRMTEATDVLGRYYSVAGQVVHGRDIGSGLGFPTINIDTPNELIPPDGVYAVVVCIGDRYFKGACNIGVNPTFNGRIRTIEAYLFDCSENLYGQDVVVGFVSRVRDVKKFPDAAALVEAIGRDVAFIKSLLDKNDMSLFIPVNGARWWEGR